MSAYSADDLDHFARELIYLIAHQTLSLADRNRLLFLIKLFRREREEHLEQCFDCLPQATREKFEREAEQIEFLETAWRSGFPEEPPEKLPGA